MIGDPWTAVPCMRCREDFYIITGSEAPDNCPACQQAVREQEAAKDRDQSPVAVQARYFQTILNLL